MMVITYFIGAWILALLIWIPIYARAARNWKENP